MYCQSLHGFSSGRILHLLDLDPVVIFALIKTTLASSKSRLPILDRHPSRMEGCAHVRIDGTNVMAAMKLEGVDVVTDDGAAQWQLGVSCVGRW